MDKMKKDWPRAVPGLLLLVVILIAFFAMVILVLPIKPPTSQQSQSDETWRIKITLLTHQTIKPLTLMLVITTMDFILGKSPIPASRIH
jgi:hypothetical protein